MPEDDLYDEPMTDQDPREPDEKESEDYGESFLAPKSAFASKGDLSVGQIHRVRVEAIHDSEVELRCVKSGGEDESAGETETNDMYE